jgi:hypothetical protein
MNPNLASHSFAAEELPMRRMLAERELTLEGWSGQATQRGRRRVKINLAESSVA